MYAATEAFHNPCGLNSTLVGVINVARADRPKLAQASDVITSITAVAAGPLITIIGDPTSIEVQALIVVLRSDCASDAENEATTIAIYFVSPFFALGPLWIVVGHIILAIVVAVAQLLIAAYLKHTDDSMLYADALKRVYFPNATHAVIQVLFMGSCYGTFELLLRGSGEGLDIAVGVVGLLYILAVPVYTAAFIKKVIVPIRFVAYARFQKKSCPIRWCLPRGFYRAVYVHRNHADVPYIANLDHNDVGNTNFDEGPLSFSERGDARDGSVGEVTSPLGKDVDPMLDPVESENKNSVNSSCSDKANGEEGDLIDESEADGGQQKEDKPLAITQNILLRSAYRSVSLYMAYPRRYFAIYANIMCILLCLLIHVVPKEMRCQDRWLAISVVFFATALILFTVRPHRAILSSIWSAVSFVFLGVLAFVETIAVLSPSTDAQAFKVALIIIIVILAIGRAIYSLFIWYLERRELKRIECPSADAVTHTKDEKNAVRTTTEVKPATTDAEKESDATTRYVADDAVEAFAKEEDVPERIHLHLDLDDADRMIEEFVAPLAPDVAAAIEMIGGDDDQDSLLRADPLHHLAAVMSEKDVSDERVSFGSVRSDSCRRGERPTVSFEPSIAAEESATQSTIPPLGQQDGSSSGGGGRVLFDAAESHCTPSGRLPSIDSAALDAQAAPMDVEIMGAYDDDFDGLDDEEEYDDDNNNGFAVAAATAWDEAMNHFGDDIDADAAAVVVPNIAELSAQTQVGGIVGLDISDESAKEAPSAQSSSSDYSDFRNVDEGNGCEETEFY